MTTAKTYRDLAEELGYSDTSNARKIAEDTKRLLTAFIKSIRSTEGR